MIVNYTLYYLSSLESFTSLGAGLDAVEALDMTVAGRAMVSITSCDGGLSCVGGEGGRPLRFSLDRTRPMGSPLTPPLLCTLPTDPFSYRSQHRSILLIILLFNCEMCLSTHINLLIY